MEKHFLKISLGKPLFCYQVCMLFIEVYNLGSGWSVCFCSMLACFMKCPLGNWTFQGHVGDIVGCDLIQLRIKRGFAGKEGSDGQRMCTSGWIWRQIWHFYKLGYRLEPFPWGAIVSDCKTSGLDQMLSAQLALDLRKIVLHAVALTSVSSGLQNPEDIFTSSLLYCMGEPGA